MYELFSILVAIAVTFVLGSGVGCLMAYAVKRPQRPERFDDALWGAMYERLDTGMWIGGLERLVILMGFWTGDYAIVAWWLTFKVAAKWDTWKNVVRVPETLDSSVSQAVWFQVRLEYGSWLLSRFMVGVFLNVLIGAVAAYSGKHLWDVVCWLSWF